MGNYLSGESACGVVCQRRVLNGGVYCELKKRKYKKVTLFFKKNNYNKAFAREHSHLSVIILQKIHNI